METGGSGGRTSSCSTQDSNSLPSKLKIAGSWAGVLDVDLGVWTLFNLRQEIARRSNCSPDAIKMIHGGRVLADERGMTLTELGIKNNAKILATRLQLEEAKAFKDANMAEEERTRRLSRIREAVSSLAEKHMNESLVEGDFALDVENLSGEKIKIGTDSDQRAIMMGLMLHRNAKRLIEQAKYKEALDVLAMAEEAFSVCDPKIVEMVDNVSILQIDTVWCYFMLRDISCLSMAGVRLSKARKTFDLSYFKHPDIASLPLEDQHLRRITYLRLELLEGVVAYHCGLFEESRKALTSAQAKYLQFQVSDDGLTKLMNMGYKTRAAKRALMISSQDVEHAANFLIEEKARKARRMEADKQREQDTREQRSYGLTPEGKLVNLEFLAVLTSIGIDKRTAAEALRTTENDVQRAIDDVTNPETNCKIQLSIMSMDRTIEELVSMGFERSQVVAALNQTGSKDDALAVLISERSPDAQTPGTARGASSSSSGGKRNNVSSADRETQDMVTCAEMENEIIQGFSADPLSEIEVEVMHEGEVISEYIALLDSIERDGSYKNV